MATGKTEEIFILSKKVGEGCLGYFG